MDIVKTCLDSVDPKKINNIGKEIEANIQNNGGKNV